MKRFSYLGPLLVVPAVALLLTAIPGCPNTKDKDKTKVEKEKNVKAPGDTDKEKPKAGKGEPFVVENTDGVIKGKVVYDGTPPERADLSAKMKAHADKSVCLAGPHLDETWIVGKDGGVENAIVFVEPPAGKFFALDSKIAGEFKKEPYIDQPHCVYEPNVIAMFPEYKDKDGKLHDTGEKLLVKNSGPLSHNTKIIGDQKANDTTSNNINPGEKKGVAVRIKYQRKPLEVVCDKHNWMQAKVVTFENPFFAVTKADGSFEIKGVPAGSKLTIKTWHEQAAPTTEPIEVKKGVNDAGTLKIKAAS